MSDASFLLGGSGDEPSEKPAAHEGGGENHEFNSAASDAFDAAKDGDRKAFNAALYAACCAVVEEHLEGDES